MPQEGAVTMPRRQQLDDASLAEVKDFNGVPLSEAILRCFRALLRFHAPVPPTMDEEQQLALLRALSGDAFHICHGVHWQEMAYLQSPTNPVANLARCCGLAYEFSGKGSTGSYMRRPDAAATTARDLESLYAELDSGNPVLTAGAIENCGYYSLVIGYSRQGPMLCHLGDHSSINVDGSRFEDRSKPRWSLIRGVSPGAVDEDAGFNCVDGRVRGVAHADFDHSGGWVANPFYFLRPDGADGRAHWPTVPQVARDTLLLALDLYKSPPIKQVYHFGKSAYEEWARSLRRLRYPADLEGPAPYSGSPCFELGTLAEQLEHLARCRPAAAAFCQQAADAMPAAAATLLRAAARAYRDEAALAASSPAFGPFAPLQRDQQQEHPTPVGLLTDAMAEWLSDTGACAGAARAVEELGEYERSAVESIEAALGVLTSSEERTDANLRIQLAQMQRSTHIPDVCSPSADAREVSFLACFVNPI